ncbi:axin isoform X2 [Adelges cooleyi]|uniref:axin isoform X2 n=1 Tax=Adelges cooleyi TaxID=133065 RepID=UPI00217FA23D|nr:axin isoform X2 [Adelges cooleyi]
MMNNNILIDSARPKVLVGEESERPSEDKSCAGQKYKYSLDNKCVRCRKVRSDFPTSSSKCCSCNIQEYGGRGARHDYEPADGDSGDRGSLSPNDGHSSGPMLWARNLDSLLADPEGVNLFRQHLKLEEEAGHGQQCSKVLEFWLACQGLYGHTDQKADKLRSIIYKKLFLKADLGVNEECRMRVVQRVKNSMTNKTALPKHLFDEALVQVEAFLNDTLYPAFLQSETYISYIRSLDCGINFYDGKVVNHIPDTEEKVIPSRYQAPPPEHKQQPLMTLKEDAELSNHDLKQSKDFPMKLTQSLLHMSQKQRSHLAKGEFLQRAKTSKMGIYNPNPSTPYHQSWWGTKPRATHVSYNPTSAQDSDLASLSEASVSTDCLRRQLAELRDPKVLAKKSAQLEMKEVQKYARRNVESSMSAAIIPRTMREPQCIAPAMEPKKFASILSEKLEKIKQERDIEEKWDNKLIKNLSELKFDSESGKIDDPKMLDEMFRASLKLPEGSDDEILDQHVQKYFKSPPKSPEQSLQRRQVLGKVNRPVQQFASSYLAAANPNISSKRRDKDNRISGYDSGNYTDFTTDSSEPGRHVPKSRSIPDYQNANCNAELRASSLGRHTWGSRRTMTDSGISVVSGQSQLPPTNVNKTREESTNRCMIWLQESPMCAGDALADPGPAFSWCTASANTAAAVAASAKSASHDCGNVECGSNGSWTNHMPRQPFVADPNMPPPPFPNTDNQLIEAGRRLNDQMAKKSHKQRTSSSSSGRGLPTDESAPPSTSSVVAAPTSTTVVYNFNDEEFPFRKKIAGHPITLKQFIECMPKKGHYRYFFTTEFDESPGTGIQEEITDDDQMLPLWKGKVMASLRLID